MLVNLHYNELLCINMMLSTKCRKLASVENYKHAHKMKAEQSFAWSSVNCSLYKNTIIGENNQRTTQNV